MVGVDVQVDVQAYDPTGTPPHSTRSKANPMSYTTRFSLPTVSVPSASSTTPAKVWLCQRLPETLPTDFSIGSFLSGVMSSKQRRPRSSGYSGGVTRDMVARTKVERRCHASEGISGGPLPPPPEHATEDNPRSEKPHQNGTIDDRRQNRVGPPAQPEIPTTVGVPHTYARIREFVL